MQDMRRHPRLRAATLSVGSVVVASRGAAYIEAPSTGLTTFVDQIVPLHVWAFVWLAVGVLIFVGLWSRTLARVAMSAGASLWTVWGLSYLLATWFGDSSRGWVTGMTMLGLAGFMWVLAALLEVLSDGPAEGEA